MFDVDRYVDQLYAPILNQLKLPFVKTEWHRYAIDLNRLPDDVDANSVEGHKNAKGTFSRGLHWSITTTGEKLQPQPMKLETHDTLVQKYFEPFHEEVREMLQELKDAGAKPVYHIDLHSMPSVGTKEHKDPGEHRADIVISDCLGKSCSEFYRELVIESYKAAGFKVAYNWPYIGGRVTETYGHPEKGQESIQVELNRALYMNEQTKRPVESLWPEIQQRLGQAMTSIYQALPDLPK
jgi:N-formylglutamate amidohydrolase